MENHSLRGRVVPMCTMQKMMNMSSKMIGMKTTWIPTTKMMMINTMNVMKNGDETYFGSQVDWSPTASEWNPSEAAVEDESLFDVVEFDSVYSAYMPMPRADLHSCAKAVASTRLWRWWTERVPACLKAGVVQSLKAKVRRDPNNHHIHQKERVIKARGKAIAGDLVCLRCGKTGHKAANCKSSSAATSGCLFSYKEASHRP